MKPTNRHPPAVSPLPSAPRRQSSRVTRQRLIPTTIKAGLTVFSFAAVTALAAFPATGFAQAARVGAAETTHVYHHGNAGTNLVPGPGEPGGGGGVPTGPGGGSGSSNAAPNVIYFDQNTTTHTTRLHLSNGAKVMVDVRANRVYVTYAGQTRDFSLDEVLLKAAHGNAGEAAERKAAIVSRLSKPLGNTRLQWLGSATHEQYLRPKTGSFMPPRSTYAHPALIQGPGSGGLAFFHCSAYYACAYQVIDFDYIGAGGYGFWFYDTKHPSPTRTPDWYYWNRWRKDHCSAAQSEWRTADIGAAALGVELAAPGVGWLAAAVTALGVIYEGHQAAQDERICNSSYPGYRNW